MTETASPDGHDRASGGSLCMYGPPPNGGDPQHNHFAVALDGEAAILILAPIPEGEDEAWEKALVDALRVKGGDESALRRLAGGRWALFLLREELASAHAETIACIGADRPLFDHFLVLPQGISLLGQLAGMTPGYVTAAISIFIGAAGRKWGGMWALLAAQAALPERGDHDDPDPEHPCDPSEEMSP